MHLMLYLSVRPPHEPWRYTMRAWPHEQLALRSAGNAAAAATAAGAAADDDNAVMITTVLSLNGVLKRNRLVNRRLFLLISA